MIKTEYITDLNGIKDLVFEQERNQENGRFRSSFFYRGMPNVEYGLTTSLQRNCGELADSLEMPLLENFIKYVSIEDPSICESIWKAMIVGQHHGLPTRLLDWTHSTLVALHFADTEGNLADLEKHDSVVWRIDARELVANMPLEYRNVLNAKKTFMFSLELFNQVTDSLDKYDRDMADSAMAIIEPPSIDQRIVNQYSFFTVIPKGIMDMESYLEKHTERTVRYVISKSIRWDLRDLLDQLNMNERMIYPGTDGIAKWLARHYYVKGR